jgi:hypothetical protein
MTGKIKLVHSGGNAVSLAVPTNNPSASEVELKLPQSDGSANTFLKTDGSGNLSFAEAGGGKILQVIQTKLNTVVSISGISGYADISGFSASITPASASNKILVMVQMMLSTSGETYFQLLRGSTAIGNGSGGNYNSFGGVFGNTARSSYYDLNSQVFNFLDDAQDTNAHVYKVQWGNVTNVHTYLNRTAYTTSGAYYSYSGASSITLMEVAA